MVPGGMVAPSDVIVHGPGGIEAVLKTLRDIAETRESAGNSSHPPEAPAASRQYKDVNEFKALQQRVKSRDATVRLRKVFVCQGECNVMQEIWIEDKKNPAAQGNPLKSYAIVHAHHHALAGDKEGITVEDLGVVDAINVRNLAPAGKGCQKDNPFFNTFIEPSGPSTLKVFPPEKEWTCDVCGQKNAHASSFDRRTGSVQNARHKFGATKWIVFVANFATKRVAGLVVESVRVKNGIGGGSSIATKAWRIFSQVRMLRCSGPQVPQSRCIELRVQRLRGAWALAPSC